MALEAVDELFVAEGDGPIWELFHENSKTSLHERHLTYALHPSNTQIVQMMGLLRRVKPYIDRPKLPLPATFPASTKSFDEVLRGRESAREFSGGYIQLNQLAKVLAMSYGMTRDNQNTHYTRPFRTIPSGGALYPLELYIHATRVEGLKAGLYHYDPEDHALDVLRLGDESATIVKSLIQADLGQRCAAIVFISALFFRSTFKYGDRGYRFVLFEAGHLAQNALLTSAEMGLAGASIGGYLDREIDRYLGFDGLNESTIYLLLLGQP
jgi:SagB-type dehydrogenase family enzyme